MLPSDQNFVFHEQIFLAFLLLLIPKFESEIRRIHFVILHMQLVQSAPKETNSDHFSVYFPLDSQSLIDHLFETSPNTMRTSPIAPPKSIS